jgi:hypothetical protein
MKKKRWKVKTHYCALFNEWAQESWDGWTYRYKMCQRCRETKVEKVRSVGSEEA